MASLLEKLTAGFSRLRVGAGAFLSGDITLQAGDNVTITPAGNVITIASDGGGSGTGLPAPYTAELDGANLVVSAPDVASSSQAPSITIRGVTNTGAEDPGGGDVVIEGGGATHGGGNDSGTAILRGGAGSGGQHGGTALVEGGASSDPLNGGYAIVRGGPTTATDGVTGSVIVETQTPLGDGASGDISINTGATSPGNGNTGTVGIGTGDAYGSGSSGGLTIGTGDANGGGSAGGLTIRAGSTTVSGGEGGDVTVSAGATAAGNGGNVTITCGAGAGTAQHGGNLNVTGGSHLGGAGAPGKGGDVTITGGASANDTGGVATLRGGSGTSAASGGGARVIGGDAAGAANGGEAYVAGGVGPAGAKVSVCGGKGTSTTGGGLELSAGYCTSGTSPGVTIGILDAGGAQVPWCVATAAYFLINRGRLDVTDPTGVARQRAITAAPITTADTSAHLAWSYAVPEGTSGTIVVQAGADNGTLASDVVYKATFRFPTGGSLAISHAGADASMAGFADGHSITFTLSGSTLQVNVKAAAATSTKWTVTGGIVERSL